MGDPHDPYYAILKRVLCSICGTLYFGLQVYASFIGSLVAYYDVD